MLASLLFTNQNDKEVKNNMTIPSVLRRIISGAMALLILTEALLSPAYAAEEQRFSAARSPCGDYTATLEEMAVRRLSVYGFLDDDFDVTATPTRLDAALLLYRACGTAPEQPCCFMDVPEDCTDAVAWLCAAGATRGVGDRQFGVGEISEAEFIVLLSRLLRWETDDPGIIKNTMRERGLAPAVSAEDRFTCGEMAQIVCGMLDYAYPDRCVPTGGLELTPETVRIIAGSYADAERQLRQALLYLPRSVEVTFTESCVETDAARFGEDVAKHHGKPLPLLMLTDTENSIPYHARKLSDRHYIITIYAYAAACIAAASASNWLDVYQDKAFADSLRSFYLTKVFPLRGLTGFECIRQCHDLLCSLASYDYTEYDIYRKRATGARSKAHDPIGFMENRQIVCDGYADVLSWMLLHLGADSYVVYGTANGVRHAWNKVFLNRCWYNVDACWDDLGSALYYYFLRSDEWMTEHKHRFTDSFSESVYSSARNCVMPEPRSGKVSVVLNFEGGC